MTKRIVSTEKFLALKNSLDREDPRPLYHQLERGLRQMIEQGNIESGDRLPNDVELSNILGISHLTLKKALSRLVEQKLLIRSRGAGTFIRDHIRQTPTIGFFYFAESESVMAKRAEYIQRYLAVHGYDLKIVAFDEDFYDRVNLWQEVRAKQLSGAIFVALESDNCRRQLKDLEARGFPHVRLGNKFFAEELSAPLIKGNERKKTIDCLTRLWNLGHRKIGLIANRKKGETDEAYLDFYRDKDFQERWLMILGFWGPLEQYRQIPGSQLARGYLESNRDITAVLVEHAIFCEDVLRQTELMGRRVPEDLSVVALTDTINLDICGVSAMPLLPKAEAEKACQVLLKVLKNGWPREKKLVLVDYDFLDRGSIAPVKEFAETVK